MPRRFICCEAVWVGANKGDGLIAIGAVYTEGTRAAHAVRLEEDHEVADAFLLDPALSNE
jgi:hypothetical protein